MCLLFFDVYSQSKFHDTWTYLNIWRVPILPDEIHLIFFTSKKILFQKSYPVFGVFDVFDVFYIFLEIKIKWMVGFFLCVWCNYTKYVLDIFLLNFFHSLFDVFDVFQFFEMKFILFFRIKKNCSKNYSLYLMCLTWTIWQNFINFPFWRGNRQKSPKFRFEANISETVALHKKLKKEDYAFFF